MDEQDIALVKKYAGGFGNIKFSKIGLEAFLAERDIQQADKVRELEKDAARYRWLRNRTSGEGICVVHIVYWYDEYRGQARCVVIDGEFLDKAIDKSMKGEQEDYEQT